MRPRPSRQRDLFEVDQEMSDIPNTQKTLLVNLIVTSGVNFIQNQRFEIAPLCGV
jgi:hypothetical protein